MGYRNPDNVKIGPLWRLLYQPPVLPRVSNSVRYKFGSNRGHHFGPHQPTNPRSVHIQPQNSNLRASSPKFILNSSAIGAGCCASDKRQCGGILSTYQTEIKPGPVFIDITSRGDVGILPYLVCRVTDFSNETGTNATFALSNSPYCPDPDPGGMPHE